ncbi:hypothetical protein L4X63_12950 [Geomonas sp. Red32]|uniref:hypothetical protein n=1 Tax=Geomonas sp. Red32 TaxID=2912856 RepID=UPI00202CACBD|nr:hypothetical protein [Geomonas sp. Red32]MCM0082500.1 hypothetical protein [Geomonas sp. Red32]
MRLKRSLPKRPGELLGLGQRYLKALGSLALFQTRSGKVPSVEQLSALLILFQSLIDSAMNGDRVQKALRDKAQKELEAMLKRIIHYLEAVADDDDLLVLQQAGVELCRSTWRKAAKPVIVEPVPT